MSKLLSFILYGFIFYIIFRLLRNLTITRRPGTPPDTGTAGNRNSTPPRVDKTKAAEADFEEIKDK